MDQRLGDEAVPVVRPVPSRNVVVPLLSVVAVPVVRPLASRNVVCGSASAEAVVATYTAITRIKVFMARSNHAVARRTTRHSTDDNEWEFRVFVPQLSWTRRPGLDQATWPLRATWSKT